MVSSIFAIIELLLKLIGLWEDFMSYADAKRIADAQERLQDLDKAVDKQGEAQSEDEFDKAQDDIVSHLPRP